MAPQDDDGDEFYEGFGQEYRLLDDRGPDSIESVMRYPEHHLNRDLSDAVLDPLSEAIGRFVQVCSILEIALFKVLSRLDADISFAQAEQRKPGGCVEDLRTLTAGLGARTQSELLALLDAARSTLDLRNGVVHGTYSLNYRTGEPESRRYVRDRETKRPLLVRVPYDRDSLLRAAMRANNLAADLLDGREGWANELDIPWTSELQS